MKLSIIIPVYNTADYLEECVFSAKGDDVELILVDDGSTDGKSPALCDKITDLLPYARVIHSENRGLGAARELGLASAVGNYVLFLDSDDLLTPDAINTLTDAAESGEDIISFGFFIRENGKDTPYRPQASLPDERFTASVCPRVLAELPSAWSRIFKRSFLLSANMPFPDRLRYEDLATTPALTAAAGSICHIDRPLYIYRRRTDSITSDSSPEANADIMSAFDILLERFNLLGVRDKYAAELELLAIEHILLSASVRVLSEKGGVSLAMKLHSYVRAHFPELWKNGYLESLSLSRAILLRLLLQGRYRTVHLLIKARRLLTGKAYCK